MSTRVRVEVTMFDQGDPLPSKYVEEYGTVDNPWRELPVILGMFFRDSWKKVIEQTKEWDNKNSSS